MGYVAALCTCNCLACGCCCYVSDHLRGVSRRSRCGRGIHSVHCANVYLGIKLKGHEVQSVSCILMMDIRVLCLKLEPLHSTKECACMVLSQKTTVEVTLSFKGLTGFTLPYVERKVGCTYMCVYVFIYYF